jgi:hypothetical protein
MKFKPPSLLAELIAERRYIFHVTTINRLLDIIEQKKITPRSHFEIPSSTDYADQTLITLRQQGRLPSGLSINDAIPFYLNPRQPMFARLVRRGTLASKNLVALTVDMSIYQHEFEHWLYNTNPIYETSVCLGSWGCRNSLDWSILESWDWKYRQSSVHEFLLPRTWKRQAELLIEGQIKINNISKLFFHDPHFYGKLPSDLLRKAITIDGLFSL